MKYFKQNPRLSNLSLLNVSECISEEKTQTWPVFFYGRVPVTGTTVDPQSPLLTLSAAQPRAWSPPAAPTLFFKVGQLVSRSSEACASRSALLSLCGSPPHPEFSLNRVSGLLKQAPHLLLRLLPPRVAFNLLLTPRFLQRASLALTRMLASVWGEDTLAAELQPRGGADQGVQGPPPPTVFPPRHWETISL